MSSKMKNARPFFLNVGNEIHKRLDHHAERLGRTKADMVREAINNYVDFLDDKEAKAEGQKTPKKAGIANVPKTVKTVEHPWGKPSLAGLSKALKDANGSKPVDVPEKLRKSFRRWAEFIEGAEDRSDGERRAQVVLDDIRERASGKAEAEACYVQLQDFLRSRKEAHDVVDIDGISILAGDVD